MQYKVTVIMCLMLTFLTGCFYNQSESEKNVSVIEALTTQGIKTTEIEEIKEYELNGAKPRVFKLDNDGIEMIRIYEFDSEEKQEAANQEHQKRQMFLSSHSPIIFQKGRVLVLYHYDYRDAPNQPPVLSDTKFGEKLQKAIQGLK